MAPSRTLRTLDDILVDGKTVLVRVDFNLAIGDDGIVDEKEDYRIEAALETIEELMQRRCKVLLLTHLGRPGQSEQDLDLEPIGRRLADLLKEEVKMLKHLSGSEVEAVAAGMEPGSAALLPNVREDGREMMRNEGFAQELSAAAEAYVNEAFSVSHRDHTSVSAVPLLLPSCAGRRTVLEYNVLSNLAKDPKRPYVAIVSGSKVHTKVALLRQLLQVVDHICLGGRIANAFLTAGGTCSGQFCDSEDVSAAAEVMSVAGDKLVLPEDVVMGSPDSGKGGVATVDARDVPKDAVGIWDVGPKTVARYLEVCKSASTVMWNGPLGKFEDPLFQAGTQAFAEGLAALDTYRVVGGGDTVTGLEKYNLAGKFDHVSVGGGSMMALLEGARLPGLEPLFV